MRRHLAPDSGMLGPAPLGAGSWAPGRRPAWAAGCCPASPRWRPRDGAWVGTCQSQPRDGGAPGSGGTRGGRLPRGNFRPSAETAGSGSQPPWRWKLEVLYHSPAAGSASGGEGGAPWGPWLLCSLKRRGSAARGGRRDAELQLPHQKTLLGSVQTQRQMAAPSPFLWSAGVGDEGARRIFVMKNNRRHWAGS